MTWSGFHDMPVCINVAMDVPFCILTNEAMTTVSGDYIR